MFLSKVLFLILRTIIVAVLSKADIPPPPAPEPIEVTELPLPPVASAIEGSCTPEVDPLRTGCILRHGGLVQVGSFLPDGNHVIARINYTGAPATPDPASIYAGDQIVLIKADGTKFSNGSPFKCLTCGVPQDNARGRAEALDYPQAFRDGRRILAGTNIIDCGEFDLMSDGCGPGSTYIYPIRWNTAVDGSGQGGSLRELRLHPDNLHIGFNSFVTLAGKFGQFAYTGLPMAPRYDLTDVNILFDNNTRNQPLLVDGDELRINLEAITVGELRGFSGSGREVTYIGYPRESSNIDVFAADLTTGTVRRLTSHPEYCDPVDISADDEWIAIMDTRGSDRQMFMAVSTTAVSSTRNNGQRRFFQPYLLDRYGDRGDYYGQRINAAGDGSPGSINDPQWNGMADPRFSLDTTRLVYGQALTVAPACGGINPLPCPNSTEPGGRTERVVVAHFTSRQPISVRAVETLSDTIPWATPYEPGYVPSQILSVPGGVYTLYGAANGSARVTIIENEDATVVDSVSVAYDRYSDDGLTFLDGTENVTVRNPTVTLNEVDWYSDLKTSPDGFRLSIDVLTNIFDANGTLSTTLCLSYTRRNLGWRRRFRSLLEGRMRKLGLDAEYANPEKSRRGISCDFSVSAHHAALSPPSTSTSTGQSPARVPVASPIASVGCQPTPAGWFSALDLELLHHYTTSTCFTFSTEPMTRNCMRVNVPRIGFSHQYVLKAILSIAALHLARIKPQRRDVLLEQAMIHHNASSSLALPVLNNINSEDSVPMFFFSMLTTYISFAGPKESDNLLVISNGDMPEWLFLCRGMSSVIDAASEGMRSMFFIGVVFESGRKLDNIWYTNPPPDHEGLKELEGLITFYVKDPEKRDELTLAIDQLRRSFGIFYGSNYTDDQRMKSAFMWLLKVRNSFVNLLKERDNEALCVLAFFCVLLQRLDYHWWIEGWGVHLVARIYSVLDDGYRLWIRWPIEEIGWAP
ncbi:hypothetical protein F4818DRAFT_450415 [Hypoxylon cercidicola]|nr:hypothetical protein F4818DRAFT_450415 [Hypoxylon cercidicola]